MSNTPPSFFSGYNAQQPAPPQQAQQQAQQPSPPQATQQAHKPPGWGAWLKAHWLKASLLGATALYGSHQVLETNYEYRIGGGNDPGGYLVYLLKDTVNDAGWAIDQTSRGMLWAYAAASGNPNIGTRENVVAFAIPPSLAHMGWDKPTPGSKLEAYKNEVLRQVAHAGSIREEPGSPYYRTPNMLILVRDVFDKYTPGAQNNPPLIDIRSIEPGGPTAPPGYNQYFMDPHTKKERLVP